MSKTIIITTDDMREFLKENFGNNNVMCDFYCKSCREQHNGCFCEDEDIDCTMGNDNEVVDFFIENKLANYMIPFS